jgi:hypothetical protein
VSALEQFLVWYATYAVHVVWYAVIGTISRPANGGTHILYGGNFVDAYNVAKAFGGFLSQAVQ